MIKHIAQRILIALAVLLAACGAGQGRLLLADGVAAPDRVQVAGPAAPLLARGADLALVLAERGDDSGEDFAARLAAAGLLRGGQILPGVIGVYVSLSPRYSELRAGERWAELLPAAALERVRQGALNPALRAGRPAEAFAAALAAIEGELAAAEASRSITGWVVGFLLAAMLSVILLLNMGGNIARVWRRSAPGALAARLWDRTPAGRRRARERAERELAIELARLDSQDHQAGRQLIDLLNAPADLRAALADLQARRAALAQAGDVAGLGELCAAYEAWRRGAQELLDARADQRARAAAARRQLNRLRGDVQRAVAPGRRQRKGRQPQPVGAEDQARLADLEGRLVALDAQAADIAQAWPAAADRLGRLRALAASYRDIDAEALALWKMACPEAYAAELARQAAEPQRATGSWTNSSDTTYTQAPASSDSASPSDWSGSYGSGESRSGGDW